MNIKRENKSPNGVHPKIHAAAPSPADIRMNRIRFVRVLTCIAEGAFTLALIGIGCPAGAEPMPAIRDVTPAGMTKAFRPSNVVNTPTPHLYAVQLPDVRVLSDGSLHSAPKTISLRAVALPERSRLCQSSKGARWPCGIMAFVAMHNLVKSSSVSCEIVDHGGRITGVCFVNGVDLSQWLLENGWADLLSGESSPNYARALAHAKSRAVGIWAKSPPTYP